MEIVSGTFANGSVHSCSWALPSSFLPHGSLESLWFGFCLTHFLHFWASKTDLYTFQVSDLSLSDTLLFYFCL